MTSLFARSVALVFLGISATLVPRTLQAQAEAVIPDSVVLRISKDALAPPGTNVDSLSAAGPRIVRAGVTARVVRAVLASPQGRSAHVGAGSNVALMGVGVAGIIIGSLVGGDGGAMISIGGGAVGLYGLFRYIR